VRIAAATGNIVTGSNSIRARSPSRRAGESKNTRRRRLALRGDSIAETLGVTVDAHIPVMNTQAEA
jgi:hypothetical protein